ASWARDTVPVTLAVDWKALGLDAARATLSLPAVRGLQDARVLRPGDPLTIAPNKGALVIIK
ncbi:MAG: hypothetical protein HY275_19175, partial [Gemmatimonadetes bacterium]|nr:hypothetical protein [Gemmatimonadota bacterium]